MHDHEFYVKNVCRLLRKLRINTNMLLTPYFYTNIFQPSWGNQKREDVQILNVHRLFIFGNIVVNIKYDLI